MFCKVAWSQKHNFFLTATTTMILNIFFLAFSVFLICSYSALGSENTHTTYVVLMDRPKMEAFQASLEPSRKWQQEIIESISVSDQDDDNEYSSRPQLHYGYDAILSGFSAKLNPRHLESLRGVDGFLYAIRDESHTLQTTHSPQFLGLREGQGLWSTKNLASDVIIGLVDSGIWPEHQSFIDSGLPPVPSRWKGECQAGTKFKASNCNRKLIGAAAFFKGYESKYGRINETSDYRSARDSKGHGTHTASTAGGNLVEGANIFGLANGKAAGMRYTARIAAYKPCYELDCTDSDILAAMEQAVKDGADVLSLSIAGGLIRPYFNDPIAIGAFGAMRNGIIVSACAGNYGPDSSTVANVAPWMMTVAASTTDRSFLAQVRLGDGKIFSGASLFSGNLPKQLPLIYNETTIDAVCCESGSLSPSHVKGKIVICVDGCSNGFAKGEVVKAAGGIGMILVSAYWVEDTIAEPQVLPTVSLGLSAASALINYTKSSKKPTATIKFLGDVYDNPAPVMATFSSRGPNPIDPTILKPDVTAPGLNILAAWPPNISPTHLKSDKRRILFNILSGTSMSCPHVSGLMALLKSLHTDWSPAAIKSALMTTAYVLDNKKSPISDGAAFNNSDPATPFAFGSGHVDADRASDPGLIYDISTQDYHDYLCSLKYNSTQMAPFAGKNTNCPAHTSHLRPGDLNYPSFSVIFSSNFTATTYKRTVTNVGIAVSTYSVKVIEPETVCITVQPKVLKFKKMGEKKSYYVTFNAKKGGMPTTANATFGSLEWVSDGKYSVRSPIAVIWKI